MATDPRMAWLRSALPRRYTAWWRASWDGLIAPLPTCRHCSGTGRVPFESDDYPPGTCACICTGGRDRAWAAAGRIRKARRSSWLRYLRARVPSMPVGGGR